MITLEPFYLINAYNFLPARTTPVYVASAEELERLVTVTSTTASQLMLQHHVEHAEGWHVRESFAGHTFERNPIVESAWHRYPWSGPTNLAPLMPRPSGPDLQNPSACSPTPG